ncbi:hypothetical protein BOTBODRAFT_444154 [Botryobasidium botryosum FD-172 SS1]|uniref:Uncharacterized protein n=1 Tax=Botryobasidium botryosum (strain FD-172 SS1) TaxID=930990 RepID=A0A067MV34_BOTB1|nr:hypothetical protein BOTBODRAFT_444154 [Botryobasidium botryosum FD-172 SS1]
MEFVPRSGDICAALYSRGDGVTFHWAFLVIQDQERGFKMHAVDDSSNVWSYQEGLEAFRANPDLVALVKIGSLQEDHSTLEAVQEVLKTRVLIDPAGFRGRFSCRTWFTAGIGELDEYAYVTVPDKFKLENELLQVATTAEMARLRGVRRISECCELSG